MLWLINELWGLLLHYCAMKFINSEHGFSFKRNNREVNRWTLVCVYLHHNQETISTMENPIFICFLSNYYETFFIFSLIYDRLKFSELQFIFESQPAWSFVVKSFGVGRKYCDGFEINREINVFILNRLKIIIPPIWIMKENKLKFQLFTELKFTTGKMFFR